MTPRLRAALAAWLASSALVYAQGPSPGSAPQPPAAAAVQQVPARPQGSTAEDHSAHAPSASSPAAEQMGEAPVLPPFVRPITDADRAAAFPDVHGHAAHDNAINYFLLFDQAEWLSASRGLALNWDTKGWLGRDRDRIWFRSEGEREGGGLAHAEAQLFYGRAIGRWWDVLAGVRQDMRPGPGRTFAAIGLQGLAPYWFEVEATAYVGESGRTHFRLETEYELLITNRLILQPLVEIEFYGKDDRERRIGAGLSSLDTGLRLRYEFRRELAPYVGLTWNRRFFGTADLARDAGDAVSTARLAVGLRTWF